MNFAWGTPRINSTKYLLPPGNTYTVKLRRYAWADEKKSPNIITGTKVSIRGIIVWWQLEETLQRYKNQDDLYNSTLY